VKAVPAAEAASVRCPGLLPVAEEANLTFSVTGCE
jgi:hypothetical protein